MLAMIPLTIHVSDTYFIVAHIHYVLFGGSLFTIFAGVYYWFPKMTGRMYDERLGKLHFWMTFIFFNLTFAPMHLIGVAGHAAPRLRLRRPVRDAGTSSSRSRRFVLGLSTLIFVYNMIASWRGGAARRGQPVARAHARVAGLLAAADLQLRRRPDRRRRPVRVRRPGRRARRSSGPAGAGRRPAAPADTAAQPSHDEQEEPPHEDHPRRRQRDPRRAPSCSSARRGARRRGGRRARRRLRAAQHARATATSSTTTPSSTPRRCASTSPARSCARRASTPIGEVGDPDPYTATMDAIAEHHPDEIIVSTYPATTSGWLRRDLVERIADAAGLPGRPRRRRHRRRGPARSTSRSWSPTAPPASDELLERAQGERAGDEPQRHLFIVVVPQEGGEGVAAPRGAARGWPRSSTACAPRA